MAADAGAPEVGGIDPHDAYRRAIRAELPHAVIVCDPFHLVRGAGTAMDSVRHDRQRVARTSGRLAHGARQSGKQHNWQTELYHSRRRLPSAWALKEDFRTIYHLRTRAEAKQRLDAFLTATEASGFPAFVSFAHGLRKWRAEFLAYFDQRATNGYAEGITNKITVIKRRATDYRPSMDSASAPSYAAADTTQPRSILKTPLFTRQRPKYLLEG